MSDYFIEFASQYVTIVQIEAAVLDNPEYRQLIRAYFNYNNLLSGRNDIFYNQNHLNKAGATIVSRQLSADLKELGI